jgi:hypothetical protein
MASYRERSTRPGDRRRRSRVALASPPSRIWAKFLCAARDRRSYI